MSNSLIEFEYFNKWNSSKHSHFYPDSSDSLNISSIEKSKFSPNYHFLCKKCNKIPIIQFIKTNKIKYICKCEQSPKELHIKDIYDLLLNSEEIEIEAIRKLKCKLHQMKNIFFFAKSVKKTYVKNVQMNTLNIKTK